MVAILIVISIIAMIVFTENVLKMMVFGIFSPVLVWAFYKVNKQNKNRVFIKENGRVYIGEVLHVRVTKSKNKVITKLLVVFLEGNEKRLIVLAHFPYYIERI